MGISHRDIKPNNILMQDDCTIKICDFGLSRTNLYSQRDIKDENDKLTPRVQNEYYGAPEINNGKTDYNENIDIYSCGQVIKQIKDLLKDKPVAPNQIYNSDNSSTKIGDPSFLDKHEFNIKPKDDDQSSKLD